MARLMKSTGIERIGEIPDNWTISRVKYVSDFEPGCSRDGLNDESVITYTPMDCIKNGWFINNTATLGSVSSSLTSYQNGDVVMAKVTPCFENGNIAIMENLASGYGLGSSELFVFRPINIDTRYFFYWLQNPVFVQLACSTMTGTGGLKRVSPYFVKNCYIHHPSIDEQQRIAVFLDRKCAEIDAVIERTKATIEEYKKLKQAVITEAVTKGVRGPRPMKDSGIEWIGEIPKEWEVRKLGRFISIRSGITLGKTYPKDCELIERPYLRVANVKADGFALDDVATIEVTPDEAEKYALKAGELLMTEGGDRDKLGRGTVWNGEITPCLHQNHVFAVTCDETWLLTQYLAYLTASNVGRQYFDITAKKTTNLACTNSNTILQFKIPLPSTEEQQEIIEWLPIRCAALDTLIAKKTALLTELETYKKSLIYEYVTGKKVVE